MPLPVTCRLAEQSWIERRSTSMTWQQRKPIFLKPRLPE